MCNRLRIADAWFEPDIALAAIGDPASPRPQAVAYTICPQCKVRARLPKATVHPAWEES